VRSASIKGALRFWWRALNWQACATQHPDDEAAALRLLHREEARLFGMAADEKKEPPGGQGVFLLQVRDADVRVTSEPFGLRFEGGLLYLLGMGLGHFSGGNHCTRSALAAGGTFEVSLLFRPGCAAGDVASVVQAVQAFGLLGSLGSRARHGMGSVCLLSMAHQGLDLPAWSAPTSPAQYQQQLQTLLAQARQAEALPPLSAFSRHTRIDTLRHASGSAKELLDMLGKEQQLYRSYGSRSRYVEGAPYRVHGLKAEQKFKEDHDLMALVASGKTVTAAPRRTVFGLPHNYYFSNGSKAEVNYFPAGSEPGRRASSLLLHLHQVGRQHVAVHTLLKARFLPSATGKAPQVHIGRPRQRGTPVDLSEHWEVLDDYLKRYQDKHPKEWSTL
jgi:CRISPR-associated protein Cmr1